MRIPRCFDPNWRYKPQWAYPTPPGARDEMFIIPFQFTVPSDGQLRQYFPIQLDDDEPWTFHGIFFPEISLLNIATLARITDSHGNPLSQGQVLTLGAWGSDTGQTAAFGFPVEPADDCAPGGTLLLDLQVNTNAQVASASHADAGSLFFVYANVFGAAGNAFSIRVTNGAALSISVIGTAVNVTINTGVSTIQDVVNIINSTPAASALMVALRINPDQIITAFGPTLLAGGTPSVPSIIGGCVLGSKRFTEC